ncbi:heavy-metal-associated domain-containing protein, partial [Neobacillus drentensis]
MSKAVYQLESLTCPSCIKKIETTLNKTNGVESTKVLF